ncbi:MAG: aminoacyl-tRNA hydrolase [Candidatus Altimarinota bacterium]
MILIVGLGNPGSKYEKNRHNTGFLAIDILAYKYQAEFKLDKKFNADIAEIPHPFNSEEKVILAKPQTFMNNSGEAIQKIMQFYKIPPENCWVIFDELDLPLGNLKIRKNGGAGTHNGMKSIVGHIGREFPRFRIGIESRGQTASNFQDTQSFVLSPFFDPEKSILAEVLEKTVSAVEHGLQFDLEQAMNKYN